MILALGVGIGASMTTLTVFRAMAADPIPDRSGQLYAPQLDIWGPGKNGFNSTPDKLSPMLGYIDAVALMRARPARRQSAMYMTQFAVRHGTRAPFNVGTRAAYADFFTMFETPFRHGAAWSAAEDAAHARVAVISRALNERLFKGTNSVGSALLLDNQEFRIVGVLDGWRPVPRFYDLQDAFAEQAEDVFIPFTTAIELQKQPDESTNCASTQQGGWAGLLRSDCVWLQFWVQLPTRAAVRAYRGFLGNYAAEQQRIGRFHWGPRVQLRDVRTWLSYMHVVSNESRMLVLVSFGFLLVCLLNAMGLMLARITQRAADISLRRALGAPMPAVSLQYLIEAAVVGVAGALAGLALTTLGLAGLRALLARDISGLAHLNLADALITVALALLATLLAGVYPAWRAARLQPAWQLRAQ